MTSHVLLNDWILLLQSGKRCHKQTWVPVVLGRCVNETWKSDKKKNLPVWLTKWRPFALCKLKMMSLFFLSDRKRHNYHCCIQRNLKKKLTVYVVFLRAHGGLQTYHFFILFFWFQSQQQQRPVSGQCSCVLYDWILDINLPPVCLSTWRHLFFLCSWSCEVTLLCFLTEYTTAHFLLFCFSFLLPCGRFKKSWKQ